MAYSDLIVFADESGSPVISADRADFPVFVLVFVVVEKSSYASVVQQAVTDLKFRHFGHDQIILHERDIRRQSGAFARFQANAVQRNAFIDEINDLVGSLDATVVSAVVHKARLEQRYSQPFDPYAIALTLCMERLAGVLHKRGQSGRAVHVVFESRGAKEDQVLELAFRRLADGDVPFGSGSREKFLDFTWNAHFADKRSNCAGLQLADLFARPIGLKCLRPDAPNRAYDCLSSKLLFPGPRQFP
ncbi:MAG: DUF3800 domain-containing protein [Proteobacteria bacterium]|nr:DUF3800 domain-containing protein [Pseudomonadota bacterium]MBS0571767.1 DUF3800 domain-containing protein [Pseudomonadota bacterium]